MIDCELLRIGKRHGATFYELIEAAQRAYAEPLVPVEEIMQHVVAQARAQVLGPTSC